jgi:hypothetical protein
MIAPASVGSFAATGRARLVKDHEPPAIDAELHGTADTRAAETLSTFLEAVHVEARLLKAREVSIDLRKLEFMSSACFKSMITWLARLETEDEPYTVRLRSDPSKHWQARSLAAISALAGGLVRVDLLA